VPISLTNTQYSLCLSLSHSGSFLLEHWGFDKKGAGKQQNLTIIIFLFSLPLEHWGFDKKGRGRGQDLSTTIAKRCVLNYLSTLSSRALPPPLHTHTRACVCVRRAAPVYVYTSETSCITFSKRLCALSDIHVYVVCVCVCVCVCIIYINI